jgi:hypothetical protein
MVALLTASHLPARRRYHADTCSLRILLTGKMLTVSREAICMPGAVIDEYSLEIAGRAGDTPIQESLSDVSRDTNLSECWHSVYGTG